MKWDHVKKIKTNLWIIKDALWEDNSSKIDDYEHLNKPIVWGMKNISPGKFKKGKIWRPTDDKTFNSKMEIEGDNLKVSGVYLLCAVLKFGKK